MKTGENIQYKINGFVFIILCTSSIFQMLSMDNELTADSIELTQSEFTVDENQLTVPSGDDFPHEDYQSSNDSSSKWTSIKKMLTADRTRKVGTLLVSSVFLSNVDNIIKGYFGFQNEGELLCSKISEILVRTSRCYEDVPSPITASLIRQLIDPFVRPNPLYFRLSFTSLSLVNIDSLKIVIQLLFGEGLRQFAGQSFDPFYFLVPGIAFKLFDFASVVYNIDFNSGVANSLLFASFCSLLTRFKKSKKYEYERQMDLKLDELQQQLNQI